MSSTNIYTSPLCSCLICRQVKPAKGIHSHYLLHDDERMKNHRHNASGSHPKENHPNTINRNNKIIDYQKMPALCVECTSPLSFEKRTKMFCNKTCSAIFTNRKRNESGWTQTELQRESARKYHADHPKEKRVTPISQCVVCSKWFPGTRKTCSETCFGIHCVSNAHNHKLGSSGQRSGKIQHRRDSYGKIIRLESSYETRFANVLDAMNLRWTRPSHMPWVDEQNNKKRYYPDFYLSDYNVYFDTKNKYQIIIDRPKIQAVITQNNVRLFIVPDDFINEDFVKSIVVQIGIEPILEDFQSSVQTTYTTERQLTP